MKIKANKLIAVLCAVVMLVTTIVPTFVFTAVAADTTITFTFGADGSASHADGTSKTTYTETVGSYKLNITDGKNMYTGARDAKGNSALKLGSSKNTGSFNFTVPSDVTSVNIYVAKYKSNTTKVSVNGTTYTLTNNSNDGKYDVITVDTSINKNVTVTTVSGGIRAMINTIEFVVKNACEHASQKTETVDPTCTENGSTKVTCEDCGAIIEESDIDANGHSLDANYCTVCGIEVPSKATYTFAKYAQGTQYADNEEHKLDNLLTVFTTDAHFTSELRLYSSSTYNAYAILKSFVPMSGLSFNAGNKVDTLNVYGKDGDNWVLIQGVSITSTSYKDYTVNFNGAKYSEIKLDVKGENQVRLKNITVSYDVHVHNFADATCTAPKTCSCGATEGEALGHSYNAEVTKPTCTTPGHTTYTCGTCGDTYTGNATDALGHSYNKEVTDPTCTEAGYTTYTCACGDTYTGDEVKATGHTFVNSICACGAGSIEASFLQVQVREDGMADVRLVLTLTADELATLTEVGVYASLSKDNKGEGFATTTVYETVNAGGKVVEAKEGTYFVLVEIINISNFDAKIYVTPFVATETTEALGAMVAFSVNQYVD